MKKQLPALLLSACLLLTVPVSAVPDSTANFTRSKTYSGQFSDLTAESTFYANISALYEYGLSVGKADGSYGVKDSLTVGQAVIFAGRIRSLYRTGDPEAGPAAYPVENGLAATPYLRYLQAEGVLDDALDTQLTAIATRAQMAHILANLLPEEVLPSIHTDLVTRCYATGHFIPDVTAATSYSGEILALYRKGISIGSDAVGSFLPDAPITRGAVAAMLTRIMDPSLLVTPQWNPASVYSAKGATLSSLVKPGTYVPAPATPAEMDESIRFMLSSGDHVLTLRYPSLTMLQAREVMMQALSTVKVYCEQSYNQATCTYAPNGEITITFAASAATEADISYYRETALHAAISVHDELWHSGILHEGMSQWEKAWVYYTWICENCVYDQTAGDDSFSHLPYSLFTQGKAVCDGYTGAYNLLLKLEGIECSAYVQDSHIWTVATLDGTEYHIDTTWGDSEDAIRYVFFSMTPAQSLLYHQ